MQADGVEYVALKPTNLRVTSPSGAPPVGTANDATTEAVNANNADNADLVNNEAVNAEHVNVPTEPAQESAPAVGEASADSAGVTSEEGGPQAEAQTEGEWLFEL